MENEMVVTSVLEPQSVADIRGQVNLIQHIMKEVMIKDQHYGVVPGCGSKPTLLKAGAEKISLTFRLRPVMGDGDIAISQLPNGHREYNIRCHILNANGLEMATGVGSCSTMEKKFRYRTAFGSKEKVENPDIADIYNTVLKMAKKRAYVDGILSATAASDIFTQDIEDMPELVNKAIPAAPERKSAQSTTEAPKTAPQAAGAAPNEAKSDTLTAKGLIVGYWPGKLGKNGKLGPASFKVGDSDYLKTFDALVSETLLEHKAQDKAVEVSYKVEEKNGYTSNMITGVSVQGE